MDPIPPGTDAANRSALTGERLSVGTLLRKFPKSVGITWLLALGETTLIALVPLFMGYAIDDLVVQELSALVNLAILLGLLIVIGVTRRLYDTRAYGMIRVELGMALSERGDSGSVSRTNARLAMGRELADFLEADVPQLLSSIVQLVVTLVILSLFHPTLLASALVAGVLILSIYALVHRRFFNINGILNHQMEQQVGVLSSKSRKDLKDHLVKLRHAEIRISDTEAFTYGAIFLVLMAFIVFNLWIAAGFLELTIGRIFSIVSYSWEFVEAAIVLPATLQGWSRLSEITQRINSND